MLLFEQLPLDLRRMIALYLRFSFYFPFSSVDKYHNIFGISTDDQIIWKLIFERDFGLNPLLPHITDFKKEYAHIFIKDQRARCMYGRTYSLRKLEIDNCLYEAVYDVDMEKIIYLIKDGADVNTYGSYNNRAAIHWATAHTNKEILIYLISHGADVDTRDDDGDSALHWAVINDNMEATKYLIEKNMNIDNQNIHGNTSLYYAIAYNNMRMVQYLVENKTNINFQNKCGETPLYQAVKHDRIEVIDYLIKKGADHSFMSSEQKRKYYSFFK